MVRIYIEEDKNIRDKMMIAILNCLLALMVKNGLETEVYHFLEMAELRYCTKEL